jgi:hypothetical protein
MMVMMIMMMMWCRFLDIFHSSVLHPFIVILVLMVLLQFSGQGAITFYTVQIFKVGETDPPPKKKIILYWARGLLGMFTARFVSKSFL